VGAGVDANPAGYTSQSPTWQKGNYTSCRYDAKSRSKASQ
jgi:hypothetical protein